MVLPNRCPLLTKSLKHYRSIYNHHKVYIINGKVVECIVWLKLLQTAQCFLERINRVTNLAMQVKLLFNVNPGGSRSLKPCGIFQYSNKIQTCIKWHCIEWLVVKVQKFVPHNYSNFDLYYAVTSSQSSHCHPYLSPDSLSVLSSTCVEWSLTAEPLKLN